MIQSSEENICLAFHRHVHQLLSCVVWPRNLLDYGPLCFLFPSCIRWHQTWQGNEPPYLESYNPTSIELLTSFALYTLSSLDRMRREKGHFLIKEPYSAY